jgi:SNF2 family DNA or RNA helicase
MGQIGPDNPALVICPIGIIKHAWMADLKKFTHNIDFGSIYEPSNYKTASKRMWRLEAPHDVYVSSFSLVQIMEKQLRQKRFNVIIVDESTKIKNPQSKTYRSLKEVAWKAEYRYVMSGTPSPNGPLDLWSQFYFVDGGMTLEPSIVDFRHEHFKHITVNAQGAGFWVPKSGCANSIHSMVDRRSVRFKASECLDLPEETFQIREVSMTGKQEKAYLDMAENMFTELEGGETSTARIPLSKLMKLREITGGFLITDGGDATAIGKNPKIDELDNLLEQALDSGDHKAIVWVQYQWEARTLLERYRKNYKAVGLYGEISQKQKDKNITSFMDDSKCRLLIAHPQSAGHGLTLTVASYSVYYSLSHNFEEFYQSSKRIHRSGQKKPCFYYFLVAMNSVDEALVTCIQDKKNMQDLLIDGHADQRSIVGIRK